MRIRGVKNKDKNLSLHFPATALKHDGRKQVYNSPGSSLPLTTNFTQRVMETRMPGPAVISDVAFFYVFTEKKVLFSGIHNYGILIWTGNRHLLLHNKLRLISWKILYLSQIRRLVSTDCHSESIQASLRPLYDHLFRHSPLETSHPISIHYLIQGRKALSLRLGQGMVRAQKCRGNSGLAQKGIHTRHLALGTQCLPFPLAGDSLC